MDSFEWWTNNRKIKQWSSRSWYYWKAAESDNPEISEAAEEAYATQEARKIANQKPTEWKNLSRNQIINKIRNEKIENRFLTFFAENSLDKKILEEVVLNENLQELI